MPGPRLCYATRQRAEPLRPASRPPPLMGRLLSRASPAQKKAPLSKGAGRVSGLGDSDGPCRIARYPRRRPGIPPPRLRSAPPFDKGGSSRGLRPRKKAPHQGSWPSLRGLKGPDGLRVTTRKRSTRRQPSEPFRPASRPPPLMGRLPSRASPAQKAPLTGELAEPARPEGL